MIFTQGESADEFIKRTIDDAPDKKNYVIVSDDKGITLYVRAQGAKIRSVKEFAGALFATAKGDCFNPGPGGKNMSAAQARKINEEMAKIWLNEKRPQ